MELIKNEKLPSILNKDTFYIEAGANNESIKVIHFFESIYSERYFNRAVTI